MGQPITVVEKPSAANPHILRLETNRPLSGMGHEGYEGPPSDLLQRPADELARRLFAAGGIERVHINGSVVTITLGRGRNGAGLADVVRELFLHYGETPTETVAVPLSDADATPDVLADTGDAPSAQASADDAPAPDRPSADEDPAEQQIEGIPNDEVAPPEPVTAIAPGAPTDPTADAPAESAISDREPTAADPDEVEAAAASADEPTSPSGGAGASPASPPVEPTPDVARPVAEPLAADAADVDADDATAG